MATRRRGFLNRDWYFLRASERASEREGAGLYNVGYGYIGGGLLFLDLNV